MLRLLALLVSCLFASAAHADPCRAIPQSGPLPAYLGFAAKFSGPVVHVIDGDSLCVAMGPGEDAWVEVRLADFWAPETGQPGGPAAKAALERIALGQEAICVAGMRTYDRIAARCMIAGRSIGDSLRAAGIREGGNGTGEAVVQTRGLVSGIAQGSEDYRFRSCAAARAAGAAPMRRGSANYNPNLDGDGDGVACEPYRGQ